MKKSLNDSTTIWYLEPKTQDVNKRTSELLGIDASDSEEFGVKCKDGQARDMWKVEFSKVQKLHHSEHFPLFKVFRRRKGEKLATDVTRLVPNFFRAKLQKMKASRIPKLKKGSEIPQPKMPKVISVGGVPIEKYKRDLKGPPPKMVAMQMTDSPPW
jgi:hypothetical protein